MKNKFTASLNDMYPVIEEVLQSGGEFRISITGISMLPLLVQGKDSVAIKSPVLPLKAGDIAFYRRTNGVFVLHRVMKVQKDGTYTFCGDSQYGFEHGISDQQIIGTVTKIFKKDKQINTECVAYKLYLFFWCKAFPLRVPFIFVARLAAKILRKIKKQNAKK